MDPKRLFPKRELVVAGRNMEDFNLAVGIILKGGDKPLTYMIKKENEEEFAKKLKENYSGKNFSEKEFIALSRSLGKEIGSDFFFEAIESRVEDVVCTKDSAFAIYRIDLEPFSRNEETQKETTMSQNVSFRTKNVLGKSKYKVTDFNPEINGVKASQNGNQGTETPHKRSMRSILDKRHFYEEMTVIPLGPDNAERVYSQVQDYCNERCQESTNLNPMATCLPSVCIIGRLKNETLSYIKKSSQK
jgi:hypothetical protein